MVPKPPRVVKIAGKVTNGREVSMRAILGPLFFLNPQICSQNTLEEFVSLKTVSVLEKLRAV